MSCSTPPRAHHRPNGPARASTQADRTLSSRSMTRVAAPFTFGHCSADVASADGAWSERRRAGLRRNLGVRTSLALTGLCQHLRGACGSTAKGLGSSPRPAVVHPDCGPKPKQCLRTRTDDEPVLVVLQSAMTRAQAGAAGTIASLIASGAELASGWRQGFAGHARRHRVGCCPGVGRSALANAPPHRCETGSGVRTAPASASRLLESQRYAGTIGARRSCTVWTISVLSIPRRYTEVIARSACPS